jgi:hypothetical protein
MKKKYTLILSTTLLFLLLGCSGPAAPDPAVESAAEQATALPAAEVEPTAVPTETSVPATPTAVAEPATPTPRSAAEATDEGAAAEPTLSAPPPSRDVEQPPYAESECSDKYPCNEDVAGWEARIQVRDGFTVEYVSRLDGQPTVLEFGPDGLLYIATMAGTIYRMDSAGNFTPVISGFTVPTGLAFQPGTERLYVADRAVNKSIGGESRISYVENGEMTTIITGLPCCYVGYHAANGIAFGPDGYGYVGVGARADHGEILEGPNAGQQDMNLHPYEASILRFSPDGREVEVYARGFRNPYSLAWDADGNLYTADNSPDYNPPEEFYLVTPGGEHGYPWYDCDACFSPPPGVEVIPPNYTYPPNSAPTGVTAYLHSQFPGYYNGIFVVLWSALPWAQRIMWMAPGGNDGFVFATGFGLPIDTAVSPDGSLYVADWATGIIFRISYTLS